MTDDLSTSGGEPRGVGKKAQRGLKWTLAGTVATNVIRLVTIPLLGRLLAPDEFGVVAAALVVIAFGQVIRDVGMGAAVIQRDAITEAQIDAAASFSIGFGLIVGVFVFVGAPLIARLDDISRLTPMIRALALMFVIRGVGSVPRALCQREFRFKVLTMIDLGSYGAGSVVSVALAWLGMGAWALIVGYLCESLLSTVAVFVVRPTRLPVRGVFAAARGLFHFGIGTTLADLAAYFANNGDYMVVGYELGNEPLGLYTRAYELMRFPSAVFSNVAGFVLFSAFARLQRAPERLGRAFRRGTFLTAAILLPASVGLIVVAPEMIRVLLGNRWDSAVLPFQILAASMMGRTAFKIGLTLARSTGAVYAVAVASAVNAVMVFVGAAIGAHWGIVGVSIAITIECTVHYVWFSYLGLKQTTLGWRGLVGIHLEAAAAAAVVLGGAFASAYVLRGLGAIDLAVLAVAGTVGMALLVAVALVGRYRGQPDWVWLCNGVVRQVSRRVRVNQPA